MIETLLDRGWNIEAQDTQTGRPPLMDALNDLESEGTLHPLSALLLLHHGATVNCRDKKGQTPLHLAATGGVDPEMNPSSPKLVETLLEHGAKVDAQDQEGMTPLMIATLHLRPMLMQRLLKHGARVDTRSPSGETALSLARRNFSVKSGDERRAAVVRLLQAAGATH